MTNVVPIKPAKAPPDCLLLSADTTFMVGNTLRTFPAGVPITDVTDIAHLERANVPRNRYELIPEQTS
jgi:hypothetical protein